MRLSDFDFDLPEGLIATRPARPRTAARLLVAQGDAVEDATVADLPRFLRPGDLLVLNDTRVIPARLSGTRTRATPQGDATAKVEITLLEPTADGAWRALAKPLRKLRTGETVRFGDTLSAVVDAMSDTDLTLRFDTHGAALDEAGLEYNNDDPQFRATMSVDLDAEGARKFLKLADAVEELDDVQNVYSNANIPADVMAQLEDDE